MWLDAPDKAGFWVFVGFRTSRSKHYVVEIKAPVMVKEDKSYPELVVYYCGSGAVYGISQHQGKWKSLDEVMNDIIFP